MTNINSKSAFSRNVHKGLGSASFNNKIIKHQDDIKKAHGRYDHYENFHQKLGSYKQTLQQQNDYSCHHFSWLKENSKISTLCHSLQKSINLSLEKVMQLESEDEEQEEKKDLTVTSMQKKLRARLLSSDSKSPIDDYMMTENEQLPEEENHSIAVNIKHGNVKDSHYYHPINDSRSKHSLTHKIDGIMKHASLPEKEVLSDVKEKIIELKRVLILFKEQVKKENNVNSNKEINENKNNENLLSPLRSSIKNKRAHDKRYEHFCVSNSTSNITSVYAEMILQLRENIISLSDDLNEEYSKAQEEAKISRVSVCRLLRKEGSATNNEITRSIDNNQSELVPSEIRVQLQSFSIKNYHESEKKGDDTEYLKDVIESNFQELQYEYDSNMQQILESFTKNKNGCSHNNYSLKYGGWDEDNHIRFLKILDAINNNTFDCSCTKKKSLAIDRMIVEIPGKTKKDILNHWRWYDNVTMKKLKEKSVKEMFERKRKELTKEWTDEIQWKKKEFMEQLAKSATSSIHEAICSEQHARLVLLREARKESAKIMLEKDMYQKSLQEQDEKQKEKIKRKQQQDTKTAIQNYKATIQKSLDDEKLKESKMVQQQEIEKLHQSLHNKKRVSHRKELHSHRKELHAKKLQDIAKNEQKRIERLSVIAASVPYYETMQEQEKYRSIHKLTFSRKQDMRQKTFTIATNHNNKLLDFQYPNTKTKQRWFTNEKIFNDLRFRLGHALHEAGIANTDAAGDIVKQLVPREKEERTTGIRRP